MLPTPGERRSGEVAPTAGWPGLLMIEDTGSAMATRQPSPYPARLDEAVATTAGFSPTVPRGQPLTYRHDWGHRHGAWILTLRGPAVTEGSLVFVTVSEGGPGGERFVGAALLTEFHPVWAG